MGRSSEREGSVERRADRGATLIEYALVLALVVVGSIPAIQYLTSSAESETENHAACIETRPPPEQCQQAALIPPEDPGEGGNGGDDDDDENGSGPPPTDPPPTTEPPPPELVQLDWVGSSEATEEGWQASAEITLVDEEGDPLEGVRVRVIFEVPGLPRPFVAECTTEADGTCTIVWDATPADLPTATMTFYDFTGESNLELMGEPGDLVFDRPEDA